MLRSRRFWDSGSIFLSWHFKTPNQRFDKSDFPCDKHCNLMRGGKVAMTLEFGKFSLFPSWIENPIWRGRSIHMCVLGDSPFFIILLGGHHTFCQPFEARVIETWRHNIIVHCRPSTVVRWVWLTYIAISGQCIGLTSQWLSSTQTSISRFTLWPWNF